MILKLMEMWYLRKGEEQFKERKSSNKWHDWLERKGRGVSGEMPVNIVHFLNSATPVPGGRKWHAVQEPFLDFLL